MPNSQGRHVWSLSQMTLNVKVKGHGHKGQIFSPFKMHCNAPTANNVMQQNGSFHRHEGLMGVHRQHGRGVIYVAACVRFMFGKTSLVSSIAICFLFCSVVRQHLYQFSEVHSILLTLLM